MTSTWARRRFLTGSMVGLGGAAVAGACTSDLGQGLGTPLAATDGPPPTMPLAPGAATEPGQAPAAAFRLFADESMNFEALFALGSAGLNSETGEVVTAVNQANAAPGGPTYQSFFDAMVAMGNQLVERARRAEVAGHPVTARDRYLRAAQYFDQALFFVLGTSTPDAERRLFRTMDEAWQRAAALMDPVWEPMEVPYEDTTLPCWFLTPDSASGPRPTVILNNGSDGQNVDLWAYGGAAAVARGWNALILQGPGQGEMLFVRDRVFRPDWEEVIGPVLDHIAGRPDVDARRIALTGWSEGGELVARAAAFEDRLAAVVSDPGSVDVYRAFPEDLRQVATSGDEEQVNGIWSRAIIPGATPAQQFELKKRLEIYSTEALAQARAGQVPTDWYGLSRRIQEFDVRDVAGRISMPVLVANYELEQFYPGQATELAGLIGRNARVVDFTAAEGAQYHCAPMAPQYRNEIVFDWLDEQVADR